MQTEYFSRDTITSSQVPNTDVVVIEISYRLQIAVITGGFEPLAYNAVT